MTIKHSNFRPNLPVEIVPPLASSFEGKPFDDLDVHGRWCDITQRAKLWEAKYAGAASGKQMGSDQNGSCSW